MFDSKQNTFTIASSILPILKAYDENMEAHITFRSKYCQDSFSTIATFSDFDMSFYKTFIYVLNGATYMKNTTILPT